MQDPLVSVILPVYNGEKYLEQALRSVFAQDYRPMEVIVVDDGSSDESAAIAGSFEGVVYIHQSNRGVGAARNKGLTAARGEFIAFIDQDDLWTTDKLSLQVGYLLENPDADYVLSKIQNFLDPGARPPQRLARDIAPGDTLRLSLGAIVSRRRVFEKVGDFSTGYTRSEDFDWFVRCHEAGIRMAVLPEVVYKRRVHESNLSLDREIMVSEFLRVVKSSLDRKRDETPRKGCLEMTEKRPLVSVIIPVYNGEAFLAEAVESVRRQGYEPLEIIVVDDGSTDGTRKVVEGFGEEVHYIHQPNRGPAAARNTGLKAARGDIIAFLDADDVWTDYKLDVQMGLLLGDRSVEIVLGRTQVMKKTGVIDGRHAFEEHSAPQLGLRLVDSLIRRSVFDKVGLLDDFSESRFHCDDMDWFMRARELGVSTLVHEDVTSLYRRHEHNLSNQEERGNRHTLMMLKKSLDRRRKKYRGEAESLPKMSDLERASGGESPDTRDEE